MCSYIGREHSKSSSPQCPDYLRGADREWGFIDDRTVIVSRRSPEELHKEKFEKLPQWALFTRLKEVVWSKEGVEAVISTMGVPLEA